MLKEQYFQNMRDVLAEIETTQSEAIEQCAQVIAGSLLNGGVWHIFDSGHMLMYEAVGRSGGLMAARPVRVSLEVINPVRRRLQAAAKKKVFMDSIEGLPAYIIERSEMLPGDVLLIGSVSGYNILPVDLALTARERGIKTIGLTAVAYSRTMTGKHPSGKRLFEACDYVLDNCSPVGDAIVSAPELDHEICPASGIAAAYINWALQAQIVEVFLKQGKTPSLYISNHLPRAGEHNAAAWAQYEELGY